MRGSPGIRADAADRSKDQIEELKTDGTIQLPVRSRSSLKERVAQLTADNLELGHQLASGRRKKRPATTLDTDDDEEPSYHGKGDPGVFGPKWLGQRRRRAPSDDEDEDRQATPEPTPEPGYALGLGKSARSLALLS